MTPLENASPQQCHDCTYKDDTLTHARNRSWFFLQYFIKIYKTDSAKNETTKDLDLEDSVLLEVLGYAVQEYNLRGNILRVNLL